MQNLSMGIADRHDAAGLLRKAPRYRKRFSRVCEIKGDQRNVLCVLAHDEEFRERHFGCCKPGELSHWLKCAAVSACLTRRSSNSRRALPGGSFSAASLDRLASSAKRSSKLRLCLTRGRRLTMANPFPNRLAMI